MRKSGLLSLILTGVTLLLVVLISNSTTASIASPVWLDSAYKGYDAFYDSNIVAYETGSTATLIVPINNDTDKPITIEAANLMLDWSDEVYAATDDAVTLGVGETQSVTFNFTVPDTSVASNLFSHTYLVKVDYDRESSYSVGISVVGEEVGIGNGSLRIFHLENAPVGPGTVQLYLNGTLTTDYSIEYATGKITFGTAPADDISITADYQTIEDVGAGNEYATVFYLDHAPIVPYSQIMYLDGTLTTAYSIDYNTGEVKFDTPPGSGVRITAIYQFYKRWVITGSDFVVYSPDQSEAIALKQQVDAMGSPTLNTVESREMLAESSVEEQLGDQAYASGNFEQANNHYEQALTLRQNSLSSDKDSNDLKWMQPWGIFLAGLAAILFVICIAVIAFIWVLKRPEM